MKWIAVILALINVAAYLIGLKTGDAPNQFSQSEEYAAINLSAMSLVGEKGIDAKQKAGAKSNQLTEEPHTKLVIDNKGKVVKAKPAMPKPDATKLAKAKVTDKKAVQPEKKAPAKKVPAKQVVSKQAEPPAQKTAKVAKVENRTKNNLAPAQAKAQASLGCYRIGPFHQQNTLVKVRRDLASKQLVYTLDQRADKKTLKAVRVYLGGFASAAALDAQKQRLKAMSIDHYVIRVDGEPLIQLGYFSEQARAISFQKNMQNRGLRAKTAMLYKDQKINTWLNLASVSNQAIKALTLPKSIQIQAQVCR